MHVLDVFLLVTLALVAVMALGHELFGFLMYVLGRPYLAFGSNTWRPMTRRQRVLLGVYFVTGLTWLQVAALMTWVVWTRPDHAGWAGVICLVFTAPQPLLARIFIGAGLHARVLIGIYALHLAALTLWTARAFAEA
jgi:hypothetical protein